MKNYGGNITWKPYYHDVSKCTIEFSDTSKVFNGKSQKQKVTVINYGTVLKSGADYKVTYSNNINAGTGKIVVTGIGDYTGVVEKEFNITPKAVTPTIKLSKTAFTYNKKVQKPTVTVMDGETKLAATDYALKWSSGCTNARTYKVVVTLKGNYSGSASAAFKIKKAVNKISAKNVAKTYSAKAQTFAPGVKISNGTPKYASNSKSVTVSKAGKVTVKAKIIGKATITITAPEYKNFSKSTKKITNLTKGKKYYVRMPTYKTVGGVKYYSGWCTVKAVTIKK